MKNFENVIFEPKTKEEAKQDIIWNTQEKIYWLDDNLNWISNISELCNKYNMSENFLNICKQNLLEIA